MNEKKNYTKDIGTKNMTSLEDLDLINMTKDFDMVCSAEFTGGCIEFSKVDIK